MVGRGQILGDFVSYGKNVLCCEENGEPLKKNLSRRETSLELDLKAQIATVREID